VAGSSAKKRRKTEAHILKTVIETYNSGPRKETEYIQNIQHRRFEGTSGKLVRSLETNGRGSNTKADSAIPAHGNIEHSAT
jgi:hypothetical protein